MPTVWIVPAGSDSADSAAEGDYLLRPASDGLYEVGKVGPSPTACTWIGSVSGDLLPDLPKADGPQQGEDQSRLLAAVQGVESAEEHRGG
jgi:hypothetical protein